MVKFAHLGDCHLGSWRQPELQELNFQSFERAIDMCINERIDFMLIAGDLFDSAYPPIEILKRTFAQFKRLKDENIKVFLIAGSHDYSVSGKTFLEVLEKGGFCEICQYKETETAIYLEPIKYKACEIYGYPGKKSGLEIEDWKKVVLPKDNQNFRILMLHTSLKEAVGNLPIEALPMNSLPKADYYALAHLHINFEQKLREKPVIYSGPIYPNSFQELQDLVYGRFYIIDVGGFTDTKKKEIVLKDVVSFNIEITNALTGTQKVIDELSKHPITDKIVLLRLSGILTQGTNADINYDKIQNYLTEKGVYSFLKNTNKLTTKEQELDIKVSSTEVNKIEDELIQGYQQTNPDKFNSLILPLMHSMNIGKQEDEKTIIYETRLLSDLNKILGLELK